MKLKSFSNLDIYNLNYWRSRLLIERHIKKVEPFIEKLFLYHKSSKNFDFSEIKEELLKDLLVHAKKYSPYYSKILNNNYLLNSENLFQIPFLTKELIRTNESKLKSKIVPEKLLLSRKTGGSTGEPLSFWSTGNTEMLHQTFLFNLFGYCDGDRILAMDGTKLETNLINDDIYWKVKNNGVMLPYGGMALSSLYLNQDNIKNYINFIMEYRPEFIRGYPAFIAEVSSYIIDNEIKLNFKPKGIIVTSEVCLNEQASSIKLAFDTEVIGQYGHTEACVFGYTVDDSFMYYCSPLYGFTEIIGDDDTHVKEGDEGEIVVTGFSSFAFPLIRYKTGDRAFYGGCNDGIVILKKVLGRTADYLINTENTKVLLTALIFGQHYSAFSRIKRWQIIQDRAGWVEIIIEKAKGYGQEDELEIKKSFQRIGKINTVFKYDNSFIKTKNGKMKFVIQNLNIH